jgi:tRNA1Val (adenine37-N6)-methyltransferase
MKLRIQPMINNLLFKGWTRPGPIPPGGVEPEEGETLDYLLGHFRIFQYEKGHRFSVDDIMLAWYGTSWCPSAARIADLGSGIGSVGMCAAWRCPGAVLHTVEAQDISVRLAKKSVRYNGLQARYHIHEGDLRDDVLLAHAPFDLVLGSPPYWPVGSRLEAKHPQAIPARLEVRGDVADYAKAAEKLLAPGGVFACVFPNDQRERALSAYRDAGLVPLRRREVIFKEGESYGLDLFIGSKGSDLPPHFELRAECPEIETPLVIRRSDGATHPSIARIRVGFGFPPGL